VKKFLCCLLILSNLAACSGGHNVSGNRTNPDESAETESVRGRKLPLPTAGQVGNAVAVAAAVLVIYFLYAMVKLGGTRQGHHMPHMAF